MMAAPRHPAIALTIRKILHNIESREAKDLARDIEELAGPFVLHQAFKELLCSQRWHDSVAQGLQYFKTDLFDGRVEFKTAGIRKEWEARGYRHWDLDQWFARTRFWRA